MLDRDEVVTLALGAFVVSLVLFYGLVHSDLLTQDEAFWVAVVSWFAMYAGCDGRDWSTATDWEKGVFVLSWAMLLLAQFETDYVQPYLADVELLPVFFIVVHSISAYLIARRD